MSENVHGHQKPAPFRTNEDNPIFGRQTPEVVPAEIPQGLHGAPALRSELGAFTGDGTDASPAMPVDPTSAADVAAAQAAGLSPMAQSDEVVAAQPGALQTQPGTSAEAPEVAQDPIPDHEDAPENVPDLPEVDTGASEPEVEEVSGS